MDIFNQEVTDPALTKTDMDSYSTPNDMEGQQVTL